MPEDVARKIVKLQCRPGGAGGGMRTRLRPGRTEVATVGFDPNLILTGSDPWGSGSYTGLVVPEAPTLTPQTRYLFLLARQSFNGPESVYLRGVRQYASLVGYTSGGQGPFEHPITSPFWRFSIGGGNISWHVAVTGRGSRDRRNPANGPSLVFQESESPALLYQSLGPYVPPNAGRPWGKPLHNSDWGTLYDLRNPWGTDQVETSLRIPIPAPCDLLLFASVWQHDPGAGGTTNQPTFTNAQALAAPPEDAFWAAFSFVQYGRVAGSLIVEEEIGKEEDVDGDGDNDPIDGEEAGT